MKFFQRHEEVALQKARLERVLKMRDFIQFEVAITSDGERIVSAGYTEILVQDFASGRIERKLSGGTGYVDSIAVTPDGTHVVSGFSDGNVRIWDLASGLLERTIAVSDPADHKRVHAVALTRDGERVVSGCFRAGTSVWDLASGELGRTFGHGQANQAIAVTPDGTRVISTDDPDINVWDLASGELTHKLTGHTETVMALAVAPDSSQLFSWAEDRTLRIWDLTSSALVRTLRAPDGDYGTRLAVTPDGGRIIGGGGTGMVYVWDLASGRLECALRGSVMSKGQEHMIEGLAVAPNGQRFVSSGGDECLRVWILSPIETTESLADKLRRIKVGMTEKELTTLVGQPRFVGNGAAAFSLFPQMVGSVPGEVLESKNWVFDSDLGEFQVVLRKGRVVDTEAGGFGVDGLLRRTAAGNPAVSKPD